MPDRQNAFPHPQPCAHDARAQRGGPSVPGGNRNPAPRPADDHVAFPGNRRERLAANECFRAMVVDDETQRCETMDGRSEKKTSQRVERANQEARADSFSSTASSSSPGVRVRGMSSANHSDSGSHRSSGSLDVGRRRHRGRRRSGCISSNQRAPGRRARIWSTSAGVEAPRAQTISPASATRTPSKSLSFARAPA